MLTLPAGRIVKHLNKVVVIIWLAFFSLSPLFGLAAGKDWCVIKDKNEKCRIINCNKATPATVPGGGPFKTKGEAQKVKDKRCPKPKEKSPSHQHSTPQPSAHHPSTTQPSTHKDITQPPRTQSPSPATPFTEPKPPLSGPTPAPLEVILHFFRDIFGKVTSPATPDTRTTSKADESQERKTQPSQGSKHLTKRMEDAGLHKPSADHQAHHIVAFDDPRAQEAREILSKFNIDTNDAANGVWLAREIHSKIHTNKYYGYVNSRFRDVRTQGECYETLTELTREITDNRCPY